MSNETPEEFHDESDPIKTDSVKSTEPAGATMNKKKLLIDVLLYTLLRLGIFIVLVIVVMVLTSLIGYPLPPLIAALVALIIELPLSMVTAKSLRARINLGIGEWDKSRRAYREEIAQLSKGRSRKKSA